MLNSLYLHWLLNLVFNSAAFPGAAAAAAQTFEYNYVLIRTTCFAVCIYLVESFSRKP